MAQENTQKLRPTPINNPKRLPESATAQDHAGLASALGRGNLEQGYLLMGSLPPDQLDQMAINLRTNVSTPAEIREALRGWNEKPAA